MPEALPTTLYSARRDWAEKNPEQDKAFRAGLEEADASIADQANAQRVREIIGRYIKLPPEMLASVPVNAQKAALPDSSLQYWIEVMKDQKMLRESLDVQRLTV